jgi:polyvinyl alcohol dehydrogenase (cytochrome)
MPISRPPGRKLKSMRDSVLKLIVLLLPVALLAANPSGEEVYNHRCAGCHEQTTPRLPSRDALRKMPAARILRALDSGAMMAVAMTMNRDDRIAVASFPGTNAEVSADPVSAHCADARVKLAATPASVWNGWSPAPDNARFQSAAAAGLSIEQVRGLKLKWAFGFDGDVTAFAPPTVIDGQVFVGSAAGVVHALRAESGCIQWLFQANGPVRSAIVIAPMAGGHAALFGDMTGWCYAVEAETGKLLWKVQIEKHDSTRLTGAPAISNGIVYVPVASWEESRAADPAYRCCTFRGSLVALRVSDGAQLWKTYTVDPPKETRKNSRGVPQYGPSGVGIWSAPTIDAGRGIIYATTGDNYSSPATSLSDSVLALDIATGRILWSKQLTARDIYNSSCASDRANCSQVPGPDFDFGSSAILTRTPQGRELLLAGQKSGIVWALDPDRKGAVVWHTRVAEGGIGGGVQWGMASDGSRVFAAAADPGRSRATDPMDPRRNVVDPKKGGGLTALRVADGSLVWHAAPVPCPEGAPSGCSPAQPGAVTGIPGVVFATSMDGHLRAHASEDGRVLWDFATMRDFETVNGVKASGGSMDGPGAVVAGGMVFVTSGYPRNGGVPGNVLLAFEPR